MTPDLTLLFCAVALAFIQVLIALLGAMAQVGLPALAGNRERLPEIVGWAGRATRAHRNMLENLVLFIGLVLVAHIANRANGMSLLGEQIFVWARLAYVIIYIAGVPWLRTGAWGVSVAGLVLIALQLR